MPHLAGTVRHDLPELAGATLDEVGGHVAERGRCFLRARQDDGRGPLVVVDLDGRRPPRWADPWTGPTATTRSVPVDADHVLTTRWRGPEGPPSRFLAVDGAVLWERQDLLTPLHREPGLTVLQRRGTVQPQVHSARLRHDDLVMAIDDRGRQLWTADLGPAAVAGDELWHCPSGQVAAVGLRDGRRRWVVPAGQAAPWAIGLHAVERIAVDRARGLPTVLASGTALAAVR